MIQRVRRQGKKRREFVPLSVAHRYYRIELLQPNAVYFCVGHRYLNESRNGKGFAQGKCFARVLF